MALFRSFGKAQASFVLMLTIIGVISYYSLKSIPNHSSPRMTAKSKVQVVYKDLHKCRSRPKYLDGYKGLCWAEHVEGKGSCKTVPCNSADIMAGRAAVLCIPKLHLIGLRKCGTADFYKWIKIFGNVSTENQDYNLWQESFECPIEYFIQKAKKIEAHQNYYIDAPGNLVTSKKLSENSTHKVIISAVQFIGHMSTPESRYFILLRNPTDKTISYLFHWHKIGKVMASESHDNIDADLVDSIIRTNLEKLKKCIAEYGDVYCAFLSNGRDGNMDGLIAHGMYVVYVREALKFIPRNQIIFKTNLEYGQDSVSTVKEVAGDFFGLTFPMNYSSKMLERYNKGNKNPVWQSTIELLDEFYAPYNRQLAKLLDDKKWLFPVKRLIAT